MNRYQCRESSIVKNQVSMIPTKEINKTAITDPKKKMKLCELSKNFENLFENLFRKFKV